MKIPIPFKDLLPIETVKQLSQLVGQPALMSALKDAAQKLGIKDPLHSNNLQQVLQQAGRWMESISDPWLRSAHPGLTPGINATGELFSNRWCTQRMGSEAISQLHHLQSRYAEVTKLDLQWRNLMIGLTGAQSALAVPNLSIAMHLIAMARNNDAPVKPRWVLPRVDCIRLPQTGTAHGGNMRSILDLAGCKVVEIGTNQDCSQEDFNEAMQQTESILLLASPNSLSIELQASHREIAIAAAKNAGATTVEIMLNASIHDLTGLNIPSKPISDCWDKASRADLLIVPGDMLLGGPECAVILGDIGMLESLQKIADIAGLHASNTTKAALLRTLQASDTFEKWCQLPIGLSLSIGLGNLDNRAKRISQQLTGTQFIDRAHVVTKSCKMGAGAWSGVRLESSVVQLFPKELTPSALADKLSAGDLPVWGNVQSDHVELVMRSVEPDEDRLLVQQIAPST
jgi:L-seryl-tRNA(Ser) seleniumtransferase